MKVFRCKDFTPEHAWESELLARFGEIGVKVHWTDQPYRWHVNTGKEVFTVLDGIVEMHYREGGQEKCVRLEPGDAISLDEGDEHVAHPVGEARILVVENLDSQ